MPAFIKGALAFMAGLVVTWIAAMVVYVTGSELGWWHDRDGGVAMGFAFTIGPFFGMIAGIAAAIWAVRRGRGIAAPATPVATSGAPVPAPPPVAGPGRSSVPAVPVAPLHGEATPAPRPWPKVIRVPLFAIIAGFAAYLAGILVFWIFWPYSGSSYSPMGQFLWHAPAWIGIAVAIAVAIREARR